MQICDICKDLSAKDKMALNPSRQVIKLLTLRYNDSV